MLADILALCFGFRRAFMVDYMAVPVGEMEALCQALKSVS